MGGVREPGALHSVRRIDQRGAAGIFSFGAANAPAVAELADPFRLIGPWVDIR